MRKCPKRRFIVEMYLFCSFLCAFLRILMRHFNGVPEMKIMKDKRNLRRFFFPRNVEKEFYPLKDLKGNQNVSVKH